MVMRRRAVTLIEVILVIALIGLVIAFTFPDYGGELRRRSLAESADRLRSLIIMTRAAAMQDGLRYRIQFEGTPDPNDPLAQKEIDVPIVTLQPQVLRQAEPMGNPEAFGGFAAGWKDDTKVLQDGTRCVAVLSGKPNFEIRPESEIAGPSVTEEGIAEFVPLTLNPDGTTSGWVTFVLTDLPYDEVPEGRHVGRILNVIVDGRTGDVWIQRAMRVEEVEVMNEYGASPILHMDFTKPDLITEDNILHLQIGSGGDLSVGRRRSVTQ
jgi:prepilin-type N-terminal cleavage/methylation domain-containing protein